MEVLLFRSIIQAKLGYAFRAENVEDFKELLPSVSIVSCGYLPSIEPPPLRGIVKNSRYNLIIFADSFAVILSTVALPIL